MLRRGLIKGERFPRLIKKPLPYIQRRAVAFFTEIALKTVRLDCLNLAIRVGAVGIATCVAVGVAIFVFLAVFLFVAIFIFLFVALHVPVHIHIAVRVHVSI